MPLRIVDLIGLVGVALAIIFYIKNHNATQPDPELAALHSNIATEIMGIWFGVRLINYVLESHEKRRSARIGLIRNGRFLDRQCRRLRHYFNQFELAALQIELDYTRDIFEARKKHLSEDEVLDFESFYISVQEFQLSGEMILVTISLLSKESSERNLKWKEFLDDADKKILEIEKFRRTAQRNIEEETPEE